MTETDDPSLIGEICHIVGESPDGPRGKSPLTSDERNRYSNLILMCRNHHKLIDDQPGHFSVESLTTTKNDHESRVKDSLGAAAGESQRRRELVAGYVDVWCDRVGLEEWNAWTSWLFSTQPSIVPSRLVQLKALSEWLFSRIWPKNDYPNILRSFQNFRFVLSGLLYVFQLHSEDLKDEDGVYKHVTQKFYKIDDWNPSLYSRLGREFDCHVSLIADFAFELTRAANLVCDSIRLDLLPDFRLEQGALIVTSDIDMNLECCTYRPEYLDADFPHLYQGRRDFNTRRLSRDIHQGDEKDAAFLADREMNRPTFDS